jgi:predicted alpha/beta superfamily hydrolase
LNNSNNLIEKKNTPLIEVISEEFPIPQLKRTRKIYAVLPHDYYETEKRYPVLYLQDAQNLFSGKGPYGSWNIDSHMADLSKSGIGDIIVIAIDHAGKSRIEEYSPYYHRKFGQGSGKRYANFVINTLKAHVDLNYRTLATREFTGIGGSSMGALISSYIGIVHPAYFSKLMIFSPSFWYSDGIYFDAFKYKYTLPMRMFIYGGDKESAFMTKHIHRFQEALGQGNFQEEMNKFKVVINPEGEHTEAYWSNQFQDAIEWLFFTKQE